MTKFCLRDMAKFNDDSTDDEIGMNIKLAERLSIHKNDRTSTKNTMKEKHMKQLRNEQRQQHLLEEQSSSSSSLDTHGDPFAAGPSSTYGHHNKKRQNGDKGLEQFGNPKRTCLDDRLQSAIDWISKADVSETNNLPLRTVKRVIFPDKTYEDHLNKCSDEDDSDFEPSERHSKKRFDCQEFRNRTSLPSPIETSPFKEFTPRRRFLPIVDSASDDDSRTVVHNGTLKGGRQSPEARPFKRVNIRKVLDSDSDDDTWQAAYRGPPVLFTSSDSEDSMPVRSVKVKPRNTTSKKDSALPAQEPTGSMQDHSYHQTGQMYRPHINEARHTSPNHQASTFIRGVGEVVLQPGINYNTAVSHMIPGPSFDHGEDFAYRSRFGRNPTTSARVLRNHQRADPVGRLKVKIQTGSKNGETSSFRSGCRGTCMESAPQPPCLQFSPFPIENEVRFNPSMSPTAPRPRTLHYPRRANLSRSTHRRATSGACSRNKKPNLAAQYPDLYDDEESEVEFFTANSYSDNESNTDHIRNTDTRVTLVPSRPSQNVEVAADPLINVVSSEDEISVVYTSSPPPVRCRAQRSILPLARRHIGATRVVLRNPEVPSMSPDPVEQVRQVEEDERYAVMLQAQLDEEIGVYNAPSVPWINLPTHYHRTSPSAPSSPMYPRLLSTTSSDDSSIDLQEDSEGFTSRRVLFPGSPASRFQVRIRQMSENGRPFTRIHTRRMIDHLPMMPPSMMELLPTMFDMGNAGDSYEAFLGIADLHGDVPRGLQRAEVNRLPTRQYLCPNTASSGRAEAIHKRADLNKECQVCLNDYADGDVLRILPCFHEFHTPCIDPWLKINNTCPVCRVVVDVSE